MPVFTVESARIAALKSVAVRKERQQARKALALIPAPPPLPTPSQTEIEIAWRLSRTRKQIERIADLLDQERDPQKLDRLSAAWERLNRMEFALAGRPMPGQLRPREQSSKRRSYSDLSSLVVEVQSCSVPPPTNSVPSQPAKPQTPQEEQSAKAEDFSI